MSSSVGRYSGGNVLSSSPIRISLSSTTFFSCHQGSKCYGQTFTSPCAGQHSVAIWGGGGVNTLAMSFIGRGAGSGTGVMSIRESDRASMALVSPSDTCVHGMGAHRAQVQSESESEQ